MTAMNEIGFDLYLEIERKLRFYSGVKLTEAKLEYEQSFFSDLPSTEKEVLIYFPLYSGVKDIKVIIDEEAVITKSTSFTSKKPFVFYGTSITQGGCSKVFYEVNNELLNAYWNIGRIIIENEQDGNARAEYGKQVVNELSKELTKIFGKGFSRSNIFTMKKFYLTYQKIQTVSGKLSWSHYIELLSIEDEKRRSFYEKEAINSNWSIRMLREQINNSLYERLLLSEGKANKQKVMELATKGQAVNNPEDLLKEPYVFEFLGIKDNKPILEKDLEKRLINHIEDFLLELGKGFMYVGSQYRIPVEMSSYYCDMVFYNKILKAYVLIDLKIGEMKPEYVGQMNMYLNYFSAEANDEADNKPIGIILCANKKNIAIEYALGGFENKVFASTYTYYIPNHDPGKTG